MLGQQGHIGGCESGEAGDELHAPDRCSMSSVGCLSISELHELASEIGGAAILDRANH